MRACVRVCVRACVRACVRVCARVSVYQSVAENPGRVTVMQGRAVENSVLSKPV